MQWDQHLELPCHSRKVNEWIVCDPWNSETNGFMNSLPELTYLYIEDIVYTDFLFSCSL